MTSAFSTDLKSWVPAEVPRVVFSPYPVGEWQTRAQVSTLLLWNAARIIFCSTNTSSLVQRDDVIPPMASAPCSAWIRWNPLAAKLIASSQVTSRHGSVVFSRSIGLVTRSGWVA